jgi:hypothetical protein
VNYFKSDEDFQTHLNTGAANQAGSISLENSILYLSDYMDHRFTVELATRDAKNVTTRHFFIYADSGTTLREWMMLFVQGGAVASGPYAPMRVVPDSYKAHSEGSTADAASQMQRSYSSLGEDPALIPALPFPVVLAKFGFLQKRGVYNTAYKTRFCRIERDHNGAPMLAYYSSVETTKVNGTIPLTSIEIDDDKGSSDELCFKLTSSGSSRTFFLRAPSKAQKRKWIAILTRVSAGETMATEDVKPSIQQRVADNVSGAVSPSSAGTIPSHMSAEQYVASVSGVKVEQKAHGNGNESGAALQANPAVLVESDTVRVKDGVAYRKRKVKRGSTVMGQGGDSDEEAGNGTPAASGDPSNAAAASSASPSSPAASSSSSYPTLSPAAFPESPPLATATPVPRGAETSTPTPARNTAQTAAALEAEAPKQSKRGSVATPASAKPAGSSEPEFKYPSEDEVSAAEKQNAFARAQQGCDCFKVPTSSFASIERKRFYLWSVKTHPKAKSLIEEACKEMKQKDPKKLPYYEGIKDGYLLHWESTKAFVYESFFWLDNSPSSTESWTLHFGQKHGMFSKKKLKENFTALEGQSFTIETPKRTFDLIVENRQDFIQWKTALQNIR